MTLFFHGKVIDDKITLTEEQSVQNPFQKYNENPENNDEQPDQFKLIKIIYNFKKTQIRIEKSRARRCHYMMCKHT